MKKIEGPRSNGTCPRHAAMKVPRFELRGSLTPKAISSLSTPLMIILQVLVFGSFLLYFPRGGSFPIKEGRLSCPSLRFVINTLPDTPPSPGLHQKENNLSVPGPVGWWMVILNPWPCLNISSPFMNSQGARSLGNRHKIQNPKAWVRVMVPQLMDVR